ncbi:MAG: hypothetical protein WA123_06315 [Methylotenera sp.]
MKRIILILAIFLLSNIAYAADEKTDNPIDYKLTLSHYNTKQINANDINLRISKDNQTLWLAEYTENPSNFNQVRSGYERKDHFAHTKLTSSLQIASHGFLGISLTAEIGDDVYGIVGYGRTNLKPYDNINFDPNDAITLGLGWHANDDLTIALYGVQDNRVIDGQQITHLVTNKVFTNNQKITIDLFQKSGTNDTQGQSIKALGASLSYDLNRYFIRLAYDPKVNFTQENMTRISVGMHF